MLRLREFAEGTVEVPLFFKKNGTRGAEGDGESTRVVFHLRVFLSRDADLFGEEEAKDPKKFLSKAVVKVEGFGDVEGPLDEEFAGFVPQWATILLMEKATETVQVSEDEEGN